MTARRLSQRPHSRSRAPNADGDLVRFERLVIEAGGNAFTLELHPRLTVVSGVGQMERDALVNELVGSLGSGRAGVHLEVVSDSGSHFAVFRPHGAAHQVVDVDAAVDVTAQFADAEGHVDLLSRVGLDARSAREAMRFSASDLVTSSERDEQVRRLSQVNQAELWVAAEALRSAMLRVDEESEALGTSAEDAAVIELIEARHARFEERETRFEQRRTATFYVSGFAGVGVVPISWYLGLVAAVPLILLALVATAMSVMTWRAMVAAHHDEDEALAGAGAQSYLGFHLQRVNGLLSSDRARRDMMQAAENQRESMRRWSVVAGDIDVGWALLHRDEIDAAVRLRNDVIGVNHPGMTSESRNDVGALAHTVTRRLNALRSVGSGNESFPALFDEPFSAIDGTATPAMLELLIRSSEHQQIVLLTADDAVCAWARLEAMTGALSLVEPKVVDAERGTGTVDRRDAATRDAR